MREDVSSLAGCHKLCQLILYFNRFFAVSFKNMKGVAFPFSDNDLNVFREPLHSFMELQRHLVPEIFVRSGNEDVGIGSQGREAWTVRVEGVNRRVVEVLSFRQGQVVQAVNLQVMELRIHHVLSIGFGMETRVYKKQSKDTKGGEVEGGSFHGDLEGDIGTSAFTREEEFGEISKLTAKPRVARLGSLEGSLGLEPLKSGEAIIVSSREAMGRG